MDDATASHSGQDDGLSQSILADEDVLNSLVREQSVRKDVEGALTRLALALSAASTPEVIPTIKHHVQERAEARVAVAKLTDDLRQEKENVIRVHKKAAESDATLRGEADILREVLQTAKEAHTDLERQAKAASTAANDELTRHKDRAGAAEKEVVKWQEKAKAGELRLESMKVEVSELHEAMAGLHGEMGAVQRELDDARASEEKLGRDLGRAESNARKSQEALSALAIEAREAEQRCRTESLERERVVAELTKVSTQREEDITRLASEIKRLQENVAKDRASSDKLNATNKDLNKLLQHLTADTDEAQAAADICTKRAELAEGKVRQLEEEKQHLHESLLDFESRLAVRDREKQKVQAALNKASDDAHKNMREAERQLEQLAMLDREKQDLIIDVEERARATKEALAEAEGLKQRITETERRVKDETSAKVAAETREEKALEAASEAKRAMTAQDERIQAMRSELSTLRRTLEQASESAKDRDRENAQRLVQLSQANSKLVSEGGSARTRLTEAELSVENLTNKCEDTAKAFAESDEERRRAAESVQRLEEELEVADAKWKAAQGQLAAVECREKRCAEDYRRHLKDALDSKDKELEAALRDAETNAQRRSLEAEASQRAAARNSERALAAAREDINKKLAEAEGRRAQEVSDARRKYKAVAGALQELQGELRSSEAKGVCLERQISQLSARLSRGGSSIPNGSGGISSRSNSGDSEAGNGEDGPKRSEVVDAGITSLRRQLKVATQAKESAEKWAREARLRAEEEGSKRSDLEASLSQKEEEVLATLRRLEALKLRAEEAEERRRQTEEDLSLLVRQREGEIERLERRNQVLSDAMTRLACTEADGDTQGITTTVSRAVDDLGEVAALVDRSLPLSEPVSGGGLRETRRPFKGVFPAEPRFHRVQEAPTSLEESWQSASASSVSQVMGVTTSEASPSAEHSLSVLADGSVGFEPPAPPGAGARHREDVRLALEKAGQSFTARNNDHPVQCALHDGHGLIVEARVGRQTRQNRIVGSGAFRRSGGGARNSAGATTGGRQDHQHTHMGREASSNQRSSISSAAKTSDAGGPLHGTSAALACGALPTIPAAASQRPPDRSTSLIPAGKVEHGGIDGMEEGGIRGSCDDTGGANSYSEPGGNRDAEQYTRVRDIRDASDRARAAADHEGDRGQGTVAPDTEDQGTIARRHIDQALRERALRRRHSEGEMALPSGQRGASKSVRLKRQNQVERLERMVVFVKTIPTRATMRAADLVDAVDIAFPTRRFGTMHGDSLISPGSIEGTHFINLNGQAHARRVSGAKASTLGAAHGRMMPKVIPGGAQTYAAASQKKIPKANACGVPQRSR